MSTWALWLALLLGLLTLQYLKHLWHRRSYPPGPFPFPLIGSLWKTGFRLYPDTFIKMRKQYGNVYTIWIGGIPVILLSGFQTVKETIIRRSEDFADRPKSHLVSVALKEKVSGISYGNGHPWKQQRQFTIHCLRKLGVGGQGLLRHIETQANHLVELFEREKGQPFDPSWPIINSVSNVLCSLVFGRVLEDENFQELIETIDYIFKFGGSSFHLLFEAFPWLMRYLPGPHKKALNLIEMVFFFSKKKMDEHKENLMVQEPQDFIDFYLLHMEKLKNKPDSTFDEESLANNIMELFVAGTNTTSTAVRWALLLLASRPDIQEKAHKEIEDALGSSAIITYHDRKKVPYTNAVIHEMQRFRYGLLASMPRQSTKDVTLNSCVIPKGSIVVPDLRSVLFDPDQWETPEEFNPNHFLDKDGQFVDREEFLPFSAGARVCPGELLARTEMFIFVISLLRVFHLQLPKGIQEPNLEPCPGFVIQPYPYKICAVPYSNAS